MACYRASPVLDAGDVTVSEIAKVPRARILEQRTTQSQV